MVIVVMQLGNLHPKPDNARKYWEGANMKAQGKNDSRRVAENILNKSETQLANGCRLYLQWMAMKNYSSATITGRYYVLNFFVYWALELGLTSYAQIDQRVIEKFASHLLEATGRPVRPISMGHRYVNLHIVKNMFEYLVENGIIAQNPAQHIQLPRPPRHSLEHVLTHEQVEDVLSQPDPDKWVGLRDRTIMEVLYSCGIRRRELLELQLEDVDLHAGVVYVRQGKGRKQRLVPIGERALAWLTRYLYEVRPLLLTTKQCNALFLTYKGCGFTSSGLANTLRPYLQAAGHKGVCHVFRHAMATVMLDNGADISSIKDMLGHELLSSTQIYTHVATDKLREVYDRTHPANTTTGKKRGKVKREKTIYKPLYKWGGHPFTQKAGRLKQPSGICSVLDELLGKHLAAMAQKNMSSLTIAKRRRHLRQFIAWCELRAINKPTDISHVLIERYHKDLYRRRHKDKPLNPAYIGRHLVSIRGFCAWLCESGVIPSNSAAKIRLPRRLKTIPYSILTQEEIEKILAQVDTTDVLGVRDRAIMELLWATGIRSGEICRLCLADIDLEEKTVRITAAQSPPRIIPITTRAHQWMKIYVCQVRPQLQRQNYSNALFLGRFGPPLGPCTLNQNLHRYFQKAGIQKKGNCSIFRHTLATTMLENGADIRFVQQILGHRNLGSTQIYTKVSIRKLKEVHTQSHPTSQISRKSK
ncbi:MAG: tyrosine-type recombinase/integrase [Nitrospirota bacterium]